MYESWLAVVVITDAATGRDLEPHCLSSIHGAISAGYGPFTDIEICIYSYEAGDENKAALLNRVAIELAQGGFDWAFLMRSTELINQSVFEDAGPFLSDYDAVWGQICEPIAEQGGQLGFRVGQAKTLTNFEDLLFRNPATTIGGGHFVDNCSSKYPL